MSTKAPTANPTATVAKSSGKNLPSDTPKASLTLNGVGPGFNMKNVGWSLNNNFKVKRGGTTVSLAGSNKTIIPVAAGELKKLNDVVLTCDHQLKKNGGLTLNSKYEAGVKKYQVGGTWDGKLAKKQTQIKGWYSNKDNLVAGEATLTLDSKSKNKANVTFNQNKLLTSKFTHNTGSHGYLIEPSYNFVKSAPAIAVTKKLGKNARTLKVAYDIKSEATSLEYFTKPFKLTVATSVGKSLKFSKPTLTAVFENTYLL